ncbi:HK97 gp10 family phage protein [Paenibacillus naphthalenovorans]|uniref:HK97 gp10 family phage protein n=1 Tax=Paenibacillus naphthalenovorans TaxID=162209 RepID=UPI000886BD52|nr:HK97 gp10 family phage protein [Paenibacillus naphthalenovorans]SDJ76491.1 Bacteriophage HK97-gp10, putative tail-component [Paenibacillus naphthalenovorans]
MTKWGSFDFGDVERLAENFKKTLDERVIERFIRDFLLEMAYRAERKIKKRTPVDTGELRRNWMVGRVERHGDAYVIEIFNNAEYASFVEYGHRTGEELTEWVEGRFMMTISMKEIERELPRYLERRQMELLNQLMNGRRSGKGDDT